MGNVYGDTLTMEAEKQPVGFKNRMFLQRKLFMRYNLLIELLRFLLF